MTATLESLQALLLQILANQEEGTVRWNQVNAKLDSVQLACTTARKPRTAAQVTHVGTEAVLGQVSQTSKFPSNTVLWLKEKVASDADFLPRKMTQENYDLMVSKKAAEVKDVTNDVERRKKLAGLIWTELNNLANTSVHVGTKDFASKLVEHLRKEWKDEKTAFEASHPKQETVGQSQVLVPDLPVLNQTSVQLPSTTLADTSSLVTPFNLSLSLAGSGSAIH